MPSYTTFPECTFDSIDVFDDTYVQKIKLQWCEELDSAREEVMEGLRIIRKKAEESLKDVKEKVCEVRGRIKVLEHMQQKQVFRVKKLVVATPMLASSSSLGRRWGAPNSNYLLALGWPLL